MDDDDLTYADDGPGSIFWEQTSDEARAQTHCNGHDTSTEIARLAALPSVQYQRERTKAAKKLGVRALALDKMVAAHKARSQNDKQATEIEKLVTELNKDNAVVLDGARTRVLRFEEVEHDAGGEHYVYSVPTFLRFDDFTNLYRSRRVQINDRRTGDADAGTIWLNHQERRQYKGLIFKPAGPPIIDGKLNLWRGWGVTPKRGEWGYLREHMHEVLAARDDDLDAYNIKWMAWAVQHPDVQAEVAIAFLGERGTGKGTLGKALCKLFGQHARHISSTQHLTGRFNAHLRDCCFLFADESYAPQDKGAEGMLKRLITEDTLQIEGKGKDPIEEPNRLHVMLASNNEWIVPAGAHERRFVTERVSETHRQEKAWFDKIYKQMPAGGYEAMLYDLLDYNLDADWHPRQIVYTKALAEQQEQSLSPFDAWWFELLQTGVLPGAGAYPDRAVSNQYEEHVEVGTDGYGTSRTRLIRREGLYDAARRSSPRLKPETDAAFGRYLRDHGCVRSRPCRRRGWQFRPLAELRAQWIARFPQTVWDDPELTEWQSEPD